MLKTAILWPAVAQCGLILACYGWLFVVRRQAIRAGEVTSTDFAPGEEPRASAAARRLLANQFELPVLFFAVLSWLFLVGGVSVLELLLAWAFVLFRALHIAGSLGGPLMLRHVSFFAAFLVVAALLADLAVRLAS